MLASAPLSTKNTLLAGLPAYDLANVLCHSERVQLSRKQVLIDCNLPISHAYFPEGALVSACSRPRSDPSMEVGMIGRDGLVGTSLVLYAGRSPLRFQVQVPGRALRLAARDFSDLLGALPEFRRRMLRYVQALQFQQSQLVICSSRHSCEERTARWLLMAQERLDGQTIPVTHHAISRMVGLRRASVSAALSSLVGSSAISKSRGQVSVTDLTALETAACDCCRLIRAEYQRIARTEPNPTVRGPRPLENGKRDRVAAAPGGSTGGRILIVEDEPLIAAEIERVLRDSGQEIWAPPRGWTKPSLYLPARRMRRLST